LRAVETPDYSSPRAVGTGASAVAATYSLGVSAPDAGMGAQIITWSNVTSTSAAFTINDVATYIASHPDPNTSAPTW
jgi:hypothetical protein